MRPETSAARESRHLSIVARRAGIIVLVHRGASAFAPENTLEAYAAAMDYGADGCEIDLRRTRDGVLVLFHDETMDRLLDDFGAINQLTFRELMLVPPRENYGRKIPCLGAPTFASLLEVARQRAMLLHLDIKEPGLEEEIAKLLDEADAWDHVVSVNTYNATNLLKNPKLKLLRYKEGLYDNRRDVDPGEVRAALAKPGQLILVDDPRVAASELKRTPFLPVALPEKLYAPLQPEKMIAPPTNKFSPHHFARTLGSPTRQNIFSLLAADFPEHSQLEGDAEFKQQRIEKTVSRAWAAQQVKREWKNSELIALLENQVRERALHRGWLYQALDGILAARALARIQSTKSAPELIETFWRNDPDLKKLAGSASPNPPSWRDFRLKSELIWALGELRCDASKQFLFDYLALDETEARKFSPPQFEEATRALLKQKLDESDLKSLFLHPHSAVRGTAILECLNHPTRERTRVLKKVTPWVLDLPGASDR